MLKSCFGLFQGQKKSCHTDDMNPGSNFLPWYCRIHRSLSRTIGLTCDQPKELSQGDKSVLSRETKWMEQCHADTKPGFFYPPCSPHRHCANMAEFINAYIHPNGKHFDGSPLSEEERQEDASISALYDTICNGCIDCRHNVKPKQISLRLKSWKDWMISLLYLLSCTSAMASSSERSHTICSSISDQQPDFSELSLIDSRNQQQLSNEMPLLQQQEIIRSYRSMNFDIMHSSKVDLIISGGTRPTALLTRENHLSYARSRGMRYHCVSPLELIHELKDKQLYWMKIFALKNILECENMPTGKWVVWLDDDIVIDDYSSAVSMLDKYINLFENRGEILITEDNDYAQINTGIILVKKTEHTRSFLHMWSLFSNDPVKGYLPQNSTLHEQQALKELLDNPQFIAINKALSLIKVIPSRDDEFNINLNTFKREKYLKAQPWYDGSELCKNGEEGRQTYRDGDSFIHHGTKQYRSRLVLESLGKVLTHYHEDQHHSAHKWLGWLWS